MGFVTKTLITFNLDYVAPNISPWQRWEMIHIKSDIHDTLYASIWKNKIHLVQYIPCQSVMKLNHNF